MQQDGSRTTNEALGALQHLLLSEDRKRLAEFEGRVEAIAVRAGGKDEFQAAVADVLVGALKLAQNGQSREVARALSPYLVGAIQQELTNSRDAMVEALYPITGRLVSASVANSFARLVEEVNRRIDGAMSGRYLRYRIRSWRTGTPISTLILADQQSGQVERILLIERDSGIIKGQFPSDGGEHSVVTAGLIAAITNLASDAFSDSGHSSELRQIDLSGRTILLRSSGTLLAVALLTTGKVSAKAETAIDTAFVRLVESAVTDGPDAPVDSMLGQLAADIAYALQNEVPRRSSHAKGLAVFAGIAVAVLAGWQFWRSHLEHKLDEQVQTVAARPEFQVWPLSIRVTHRPPGVQVTGLVATEGQRAELLRELADLTGYPLSQRLIAVSGTGDQPSLQNVLSRAFAPQGLVQDMAGMQQRVQKAETTQAAASAASGLALGRHDDEMALLRARLDASALGNLDLAAKAAENSRALAVARTESAEQQSRIEVLQGAQRDLERRAAASEAALRVQLAEMRESAAFTAFLQRSAIFFTFRAELHNETQAQARIGELAGFLAGRNDRRIRIVGYADSLGGEAASLAIARERAQRVQAMLVSAGTAVQQLVMVPRLIQGGIAEQVGKGSPNRHVRFELVLDDEPGSAAPPLP